MLTKLLNKKNIPIDMIEFEKKSKIYLDNVRITENLNSVSKNT